MSCKEYLEALEKSLPEKLESIVKDNPSAVALEMANCTYTILGASAVGSMFIPILGSILGAGVGLGSCSEKARSIMSIKRDLDKINKFKNGPYSDKMCTYGYFGKPNGLNNDYKVPE
jgi:hypothetical protein